MDRRDFLLFKTRGSLRVADISCERLYMRSVDFRLTGEEAVEGFDRAEEGEPPTAFARQTSRQLFEGIEHDLTDADVVRVTDRQWLDSLDDEWRRGLEDLLASVRARGGQVEFAESSRMDSAARASGV